MRCAIVRFVISLSACCGATCFAQQSAWFKKYQTNWTKARQAHAAKDYAEAARYYSIVAEHLGSESSSRYYLACCLAQLGKTDEAFASLEKAIEFGWDDPLAIAKDEAELETLRGGARIKRLVELATACKNETAVVYAGNTVDRRRPAAVVVVLHGRGGNARGVVPRWKAVADRLGMILVVPRGVTALGKRVSYAWDKPGAKSAFEIDGNAVGKAIDRSLDLAARRYRIDRKKVILAGFSQGGGVALRMLGDHPDRFVGAFTICTGYIPQAAQYWASAAEHGARCFLIAGKLDGLMGHSSAAHSALRSAGVEARLIEIEAMGHEPPPDYLARQIEAVRFILD